MNITSQMIFHLLARKHSIRQWSPSHHSIKLLLPKLYRGQKMEPGTLYVMDELTDFQAIPKAEGCAMLILTAAPYKLPESFSGSDAAFISCSIGKFDLFDEVTALFCALQSWDIALKDSCYTGGDIDSLMELGRQILPHPLVLYDGEKQLSVGLSPDDDGNSPYGLFLEMGYKLHTGAEEAFLWQSEQRDTQVMCRNLILDGNVMAIFLSSYRNEAFLQGNLELFSHLASYIFTVYLNDRNCSRKGRMNDHFRLVLSSLMFKEHYSLTQEDLVCLARYGWNDGQCYRVIFMQPMQSIRSQLDAAYIKAHLEQDWPNSCVIQISDGFAWVLKRDTGNNAESLEEYLSDFIQKHMLLAGLSNSFNELSKLAESYWQACDVLKLGHKKHPERRMFEFRDFLLDFILQKISQQFPVDQILCPAVQSLIVYDRENQADFTRTLDTYLNCQFNASSAAEKLSIHRSTFLRRLDRIQEISGLNLKDPDELLHAMISLRLCLFQESETSL